MSCANSPPANMDIVRRIECEVFEKANFEAEIEDLKIADDHYAAILPLRSATPKTQTKY